MVKRKVVISSSRPFSVFLLFLLLGFQAMSGIYGGLSLVLDPTGALLQMPLNLLRDAPFSDYFIPGIILFTVLGIGPLAVAYRLWKKYRRAYLESLVIGIALLIWIGIQILFIGYQSQPPLQLIYGSVGILIVLLSIYPSVKNHLLD